MNNIQLYINDELADLSDDSPIALTFQINNLAEVQNQQGNTSNQFKLPLTQRNRKILGFPDDVAFCDNKPYTKYDAKFLQDGLEIIPYGIGELSGIDQDTANITILSGNVDFFDAIDGKLYDMGDSTTQWYSPLWKPYDHAWNVDNVAESQIKTDGWIYPMVDYGNFSEDFTQPVNVNFLRPGFFIKTAVDILAKSAGYKAIGSLLNDPLYPLLIAQFSNGTWEHSADYQSIADDPLSCSVLTTADMYYGNVDKYAGNIPFYHTINDPSTLWYPGDQSYRAPASVSASAMLIFSATVVGDPKKHNKAGQTLGIEVRIKKYNAAGNEILTSTTIDLGYNAQPIGSGLWQYTANDVKLSVDVDLVKEDHIYIEYSINNNKSQQGGLVTFKAGATLTITSKRQNVLYGQTVQCERIFPDISQKDLLKDTLQRFGIICQTDNAARTISFNSFHDIVGNISIAKNWTSKCLDQGKTISFQLGGYAQVNTLKYKEDDAILPAGFADTTITVADTTLQPTADLFESQFAPTLNREYTGGTIAQIQMIDAESGSSDFTIGVSPRILIDQKLNIGALGKSVTFTDGNGNNRVVNDYISTPYFYKPDAPQLPNNYGTASLLFEDLRKKYYPELEKILKQTKKVVRYFLLTPRDILELDLLIPVYLEQDSAYYYINKIDAWRKGQPTKVELVKLG